MDIYLSRGAEKFDDLSYYVEDYLKRDIAKYIGISPDTLQRILKTSKQDKIKIKTKYGVFTLDFTHVYSDDPDVDPSSGFYYITSENGLKIEIYSGDNSTSLIYDGVRYESHMFIDPDNFGDDKENVERIQTIFTQFSYSANIDDNDPLVMIIENNRKELQTLGFDINKAKVAVASGKSIYSKDRKNQLDEYGDEDVELHYNWKNDGPLYYLNKRCFDYTRGQGAKITEISWKDLINGKIPNVKDELSELFHTGYLLYIGGNDGLKEEDRKVGVERVWEVGHNNPKFIHVQEVTVEALKEAFDKYRKLTLVQQNLIFEYPDLIESICKLFGISREDLEALREKSSLSLSNGVISCNQEEVKINYEDMINIKIEPAGDDYNLSVRDEHANVFIVPNKENLTKSRTSDGWYYMEDVDKCFPDLRYYVRLDQDPYDMAIFDDKKVIVGRGPEYNRPSYVTNPEDAENYEIDYSKYADRYFMVYAGDGNYEEATYEEFLDAKNYNRK